ncbi:hypothetical protein B9Y60_10515 [Stenotrophomonas maltophilia]|uniref:hypothetical protein n=1 Tax=Stenotrophomonas maltophilia TaxID=40324 RepID=UPI000C25F818|nr:hypothetical protein [Stenotrophomonas maltophilia]PJL52189.1 hypothetical protein B9Y73_10515 [Stenotrophomonas maltophilia]PJL55110.1 hypothetical protein B9Y60_10515 [Stenotrophomonas maltophilia]
MSVLSTLSPAPDREVSYSKYRRQRFAIRVMQIRIEKFKKNGWVNEARKLQKSLRQFKKEHRELGNQLFLRQLIKKPSSPRANVEV